MTIDWTGNATARRIEALEQDVASLRDTITNLPPPPEDPRIEQLVLTLAAFEHRLAALEDRVTADGEAIAEQAAANARGETHVQADRKELARLRIEMVRLDREFTRNRDEIAKIATGLLDRVERASRLAANVGAEPSGT